MDLVVLLFEKFETLDVFGPVEVLGKLAAIARISFVSLPGGPVVSSQQVPVATQGIDSFLPEPGYILLIPGGAGTRTEIDNQDLLEAIKRLASGARFILSVCTGAALLARTGLLRAKQATTNKRAWDWVVGQNTEVKWVKKARWVRDGNIYTSSGVSAGIDMALGFAAEQFGRETAADIACQIEYLWNQDSEADPFAANPFPHSEW